MDAFRKELRDTFLGVSLGVRQPPLTWDDIHRKWPGSGTHDQSSGGTHDQYLLPPWLDFGQGFSTTRGWSRPGYDMQEVDAFLKMAKLRLAAIRRIDPVSGTILTEWAEWADSTRFSTTPRKGGYDTAEVDAFRQEIRDTFLGVRQPPLTSDEARDKRFRMARRGYDVVQVDAFFDEAEQRLAAMRPTDRGRRD